MQRLVDAGLVQREAQAVVVQLMVGSYLGVDHATVGLVRALRCAACCCKYSAPSTAFTVDQHVILAVQSDLIACIARAGITLRSGRADQFVEG